MITAFIRRVLPVLGLCVLMGSAVRQQVVPGADNDLWFHLRFGRELLGDWDISAPGHLSSFDSADWVATQWLPQMGLARLVDAGGLAAVLWVVGTLVLALVCLVYLTCRREAAPLPAAMATGLTYVVAAPGLGPRPQLLSYVLIAVCCAAWLKTVEDGRPRWWLVALAWLWPMLHGMWPVGVLLGAVAVAGMALQRRWSAPTLRWVALVPLLSLVASACTPLGLDVFRSLGAVGSRSAYFTEWASPSFSSVAALPLLVMAAVVVLDGLRRSTVDWPEALWLGLAIAWALYSVRTAPVAAIMLAPMVARSVQRLVPADAGPSRREVVVVLGAAAVASAVLVPVAAQRDEARVVPAWVDQRLDAMPGGSAVLDEWDFGPYLLWRHPDLQVVAHGYGDVFTDAELARNAGLMLQQPGWREDLDELDVDVALVDPDTPLGYALMDDPGWRIVEADDAYALLEPTAQS
ncbi:hypothetical protein ASC64_19180 [Nocardioides sp. Root122]|uniref:hypothetical protein n=1 Tax=Nocardioides TaxID=1839 RepID=UPI000703086E|nr:MULTISPECIES: hypothetical protein [Nocardioides]KQV72774.1 hypothetical protein ASC64_19180 [Nocardioides sp. Root122]MCK9825325.1 hypothetical protein [Nocardioides cavernae]